MLVAAPAIVVWAEDDHGTESQLPPGHTGSGPFTVTPIVANEKAKPRDIIKKELLIVNTSNERKSLRATVENLDPNSGAQAIVSPGVADLSQSLANWIEITRGVITLAPGESRKVPYLIHVNLSAKPGSYFARISFTDGTIGVPGSGQSLPDGTSLVLNLEVQDDARERLQLGSFTAERSLILGGEVTFAYLLENVGNRKLEPRGSIRIFNRRGEEVGSVPLNADGKEITPENREQLAAAWTASGRFGKYKAFLDLEYGDKQLASVQDSVYFWVFPWKEIMATLVGVFVLAVLGTYVIHLRTVARPIRVHQPAYAAEGTREHPRSRGIHMPSQDTHPRPEPQQPAPVALARVTVPPLERSGPEVRGATIALTRTPRASTQGNVVQLPARR